MRRIGTGRGLHRTTTTRRFRSRYLDLPKSWTFQARAAQSCQIASNAVNDSFEQVIAYFSAELQLAI